MTFIIIKHPQQNNIRRPLPQELLEEEPVYVNPKQ